METDLSRLKLVFEKGPRKDEALEFTSKLRLTISIGRVVKGNKVTIKDNGISSNHLSINWLSQGKWVVRDLDSSNGTFLNSLQLQPLTDYDLRDGDELKFGEVTSIRVRFSNVSNFHTDRKTRAGARVLEAEKPDGGEKVAEEVSRRGRSRGRGRGRGAGVAGSSNEGFATESTGAVTSVDLGANVGEHLLRRNRSRRGNDDGSSGLEVSALAPSVDTQENMESNAPEQGTRRGRGRQKSENPKTSTMSLVKEEMLNTAENVTGTRQERGRACRGKTRIIQNVMDETEVVDERSEKGTDAECKAEPEVSLRRSTRRTRKQAIAVLPPVLEGIPEAPQSADSVSCEEVVGVPPTKKLNTRTRQGRKKGNEKGAEKELNEGEMFSSEPVDGVQTDECLASDLVYEQEKSKSSKILAVKSEPQSSVREVVSGGDQPRRELTTDIVQNNENLASELNHEDLEPDSSRDEPRGQPSNESTSGIVQLDGNLACELNPEESERSFNPDDKGEPESNIRRKASQDPATDGHTTEKDVMPDIARDLEKMTLGDWFDYLEEFLPKQIRAETDQIIEDMRITSQQFHEFMLQQQK